MYSQNNNRIITKYSEFLKEQEDLEHKPVALVPPEPTKHVIERSHSLERSEVESDSGKESTPAHTASTVTVTSAEVHNIDSDGESGVDSNLTPTRLPATEFTSSKFSDLFSSSDSHALYQRNLLIQSEEGSFLRDVTQRRKTEGYAEVNPDPVVHDNPKLVNDLSVTKLDEGYDTVSLGHYYSASITSSSLAEAEMTLRRELLNNIRAISKATYFEDLYATGGKSGGDLEPGVSSDSNNNPNSGNRELDDLLRLRVKSPGSVVVTERGEDGLLVFEEAEVNVVSPVNMLAPSKESEIHQWILNSQHESETEAGLEDHDLLPEVIYKPPEVKDQVPVVDNQLIQEISLPLGAALHEPLSAPNSSVHRDSIAEIDRCSDASDQAQAHVSFVNISEDDQKVGEMSIASDSDFKPLYDRVRLEERYHGMTRRSSLPSPGHLLSKPCRLKNMNFSLLPPLHKQVRYPAILPKRLSPVYPVDESENRARRGILGKVPGVLLRQNMDQWVAKIVRFYINGDEHLPRFEYRFRPGRDVYNFDGLCDILSTKIRLPRGVRYIFTLHGDLIENLDDFRHEHAYVVASTKKFKALNYGGEVVESSKSNQDEPNGGKKRRSRSRSRPPSAPSNRNPPIIRVRRERSLNGVAWGSPQQEWSSSSDQNGRSLRQSALEAEKVLRAAIEQSQGKGSQAPPPPVTMNKQIIRVINGGDPTIQSQVLLNTRVSQEFDDLCKDLGLAVKIPRSAVSRMETLTGRPIQSYSQLRSQLKAGNEAFYIYNLSLTSTTSTTRPTRTYLGDDQDLRHSPFGSMTKSISNPTLPSVESSLGKKFPNSVVHLTPASIDQARGERSNPKASSSSSLLQKLKDVSKNRLTLPNTRLTNAVSHPNLNQRRKSVKQRYDTSTYLVNRSSSPSP